MPLSRMATVTAEEPVRPAAHTRSMPMARWCHCRGKNSEVAGAAALVSPASATAVPSASAVAATSTGNIASGCTEATEAEAPSRPAASAVSPPTMAMPDACENSTVPPRAATSAAKPAGTPVSAKSTRWRSGATLSVRRAGAPAGDSGAAASSAHPARPRTQATHAADREKRRT